MSENPENSLPNVTGTPSATFVYDGDGNRVKSTINTTTTAFIGNHTEWDVASSSLTRYYYAGSTRIAMRKNNTVYYLLSDHLGSTSLTTDDNGQNPVKQLYLPWGEVRYSSGGLQTKYTYTGQYSNVTDFGLMYYNARWYDSLLGRFTQADTMVPQPGNPQDWDRFSYVNNNPINSVDPSGHRPCNNLDENGECIPERIKDVIKNPKVNSNDVFVAGYTQDEFRLVWASQGNTNYCGPYSLASVLSLKTGSNLSGEDVNEFLERKNLKRKYMGIPGRPLTKGANLLSPEVNAIYQKNGTIGTLLENVNNGSLTMVGISWQNTSEILKLALITNPANEMFKDITVGHWLVVAGYNEVDSVLILLDPGIQSKQEAPFTRMSYTEFVKLWTGQSNMFIGSGDMIFFP
jgi:RHS repeat-associated protein